jgi:beta-galactosidase
LPVLKTAPGETDALTLPLKTPSMGAGQECFLNVRFVAAKQTFWCEAEHEVAYEQLPSPFRTKAATKNRRQNQRDKNQTLKVNESESQVVIRSGDVEAIASQETGTLTSLLWRGEQTLVRGPQLSIWRAATDNDGIKAGQGRKTNRWGVGSPPV